MCLERAREHFLHERHLALGVTRHNKAIRRRRNHLHERRGGRVDARFDPDGFARLPGQGARRALERPRQQRVQFQQRSEPFRQVSQAVAGPILEQRLRACCGTGCWRGTRGQAPDFEGAALSVAMRTIGIVPRHACWRVHVGACACVQV